MGDHDHRAGEFVDSFKNLLLRHVVKRRCCLIQNQHARSADQCAGNQDPLALTAGEAAGIGLGDLRVDAERKRTDVITDTCFIQCAPYFLFADLFRCAEGDVAEDGAREELAELEDRSDPLPQGFLIEQGDVLVVKIDRTGIRGFHAHENLKQGALSASAFSDDGNLLTGPDI